jgi:hypothetical protein
MRGRERKGGERREERGERREKKRGREMMGFKLLIRLGGYRYDIGSMYM